jgi:membrane fusion protein (multidrug efflux system)
MSLRFSVSILSTLAMLAVGCAEEEVVQRSMLPSVAAATVEAITLSEEIRASGELRARFHTTIAAEIEGRVTEITIEEGEAVEANAVVIEIDPARRRLDLEAASARLAQARANLVKETSQAERIRKLRSEKVASEQQLEEAETALLLAKSRVAAEQAALGVAERALADASVSAPFAGFVASRTVQLGEFVQKGKALFEIVSLDPLEAVFSLTELDTDRVREGQTVSITVGAFRERTFEGVVTFVSPTVDPATRTLRIKAEISNTDGILRPGLFARVNLGVSRREGVLVVPEEAIIQRAAGASVFRISNDDRVESVAIETGSRSGGRVEIRGALRVGDRVVRRGHGGLADGAVVAVQESERHGLAAKNVSTETGT